MSDRVSSRRIAIVGGGISGLTAAFHLQQTAPHLHYDLFEAQDQWGGVLQTTVQDGFLIERSADSYLDTPQQPWATQLAQDLGLADQLIEPNLEFRKAQILFRGQLHDVPAGFYLTATTHWKSLFRSPLLTWPGKLRLACEPWVPKKQDDREESLRQFAQRRVGREVYERLVQPLVAGIYSADPDRLSVSAALPKFVEWEQDFGSLTAGLRAERAASADSSGSSSRASQIGSGARYAQFRTFRQGMKTWAESLTSKLRPTSLHRAHRVSAVRHGPNGSWLLQFLDADSRMHCQQYDGVLLATPHLITAAIMEPVAPGLSNVLRQVGAASVAIVSVGLNRRQLSVRPHCFGIVVPLIEQRNMIAISFSSMKFPDRAPEECELARVFVGGACHERLLDLEDSQLQELALRELRDVLGMSGEPRCVHLSRWMQSTPQYELGHALRLQAIQDHLMPLRTIAIAGNAFHGIGIPQCVHQARQSAARIQDALRDEHVI